VVGIDLGTSNTVVAWATGGDPEPRILPVDQRVTPTTREALPLLPSCAYALTEDEMPPEPDLGETDDWVLGEVAKRRGAEVPGRLVASSKSWLCHPRIDKEAPILPWGADDEVPKLSPVEVAARLLSRVRRVWDAAHPGAPLASQRVVLTVPASFDEVARELTLRAARAAGLSVRLLEEPQAAFYAAMRMGALAPLLASLPDGETSHVLVVDLGGGTTDLSLLEVHRTRGATSVRRVAVGDHLLLGGDNMDLALAHALEPRLVAAPDRLDPRRFSELVQACRRAKESLLARGGPDSARVTIAGRGSQLVGSTLRVELSREEAVRIVVDGFLPLVEPGARPARARGALVALGLPYERDTAITRHVAAFLGRHLEGGAQLGGVLLNGGVFRAGAVVDRLLEALARVAGRPPVVLDHPDPDLAVALGAAVYGLALSGTGTRIEGGAAHSYFVGVGRDASGQARAACVVPKGASEGAVHRAADRALTLLVGRPARFDLYTSDRVGTVEAGDIVTVDAARFRTLAPLTTTVAAETRKEIGVVLEAELTPIGTLEIACVERDPKPGSEPLRFKLAFDLRAAEEDPAASIAPSRRPGRRLDEALDLVSAIYRKGTTSEARDAKSLPRDLEKLLGDRDDWTADTTRTLADRLLEHVKGRRRTADHERVFFQLVGFCLRPGMGAPGDDLRSERLAPLFAERVGFPKEARNWQQFLICFRRCAAGFSEAVQTTMRDELDAFVAEGGAKGKKPKGPRPESSEPELLDLLAHLERVAPARRAELGGWILERTWTKRDPRLWAAIGRLGARVPSYASAHHVVSRAVVEKWLDQLLRDKWSDLPAAPRAASDMARMTGDRARDVSESARAEVLRRLEREGADERFLRVVREVTPIQADERATFFGERLPPGLRLA
jgi:molecular chaperone DnaK (HSP70)